MAPPRGTDMTIHVCMNVATYFLSGDEKDWIETESNGSWKENNNNNNNVNVSCYKI